MPHMSQSDVSDPDGVRLSATDLEALCFNLRRDGYFQLDAVMPPLEMIYLSACIERLWAEGIPPLFVFVYDECWRCFERLHDVLQASLGETYQQTANFWGWYIHPSSKQSGWSIHRDREDVLLPDGSPQRVTVWISISDATPLNSCMYLIPAYLDPVIREHRDQVIPNRVQIEHLEDIRALPVPAGSVLCWSDVVAHWGSRSSDQALYPRISIACEFQRGDVEQFDSGYLVPLPVLDKTPDFHDRLRLISRQLVHYGHRYAIPGALVQQVETWGAELT